ncbi:hypothetical protein QJQ45_025791 [Haematococcus lacustris]|nr:hypothetical protein QJQ45_025791 [Haematococcus lacustris]
MPVPSLELQLWRLAGAATWHALFYGTLCAAWTLTLPRPSPGSWFSLASISTYTFLYSLQLLVFMLHHLASSSTEPQPLHVPQLWLPNTSWAAQALSRLLLRDRSVTALLRVAGLAASTCIAAPAFLYAHSQLHYGGTPAAPRLATCVGYGLALGLVYTTQHLVKCRDVLQLPPIHRHRYFKMRQQLPAVLGASLRLALCCLALLLASSWLPPQPSASPLALEGVRPLSTLLQCSWLLLAGWLLAPVALDAVFSEPWQPQDQQGGGSGAGGGSGGQQQAAWGVEAVGESGAGLAALARALGSDSSLVQVLALQQLAWLCEGRGPRFSALRSAVWADDSGRSGWTPLATFLMVEVRDMVAAVAAALPACAGDASRPKPSAGGAQVVRRAWNATSALLSGAVGGGAGQGARPDTWAQGRAAWTLRSRLYRQGSRARPGLRFVVRALSGLCAASRLEDTYGCVLLSSPGLGEAVQGLLAAVLALQTYARLTAAARARRSGRAERLLMALTWLTGPQPHATLLKAEVAAYTLEQEARRGVQAVAAAFGPSLLAVVKESPVKAAYGSPPELTALLASMLAWQE